MPLNNNKSDKDFKSNIKTELKAGKPKDQALAIAYSMKRRAKKMADGGQAQPSPQPLPPLDPDAMKAFSRGFNKRAHGGQIEGDEMKSEQGCPKCNGSGCVQCMSEGGQITNKGHQHEDAENMMHMEHSGPDNPTLAQEHEEGRGKRADDGVDNDLQLIEHVIGRRKMAMGGKATSEASLSQGPLEDAFEPTDDFSVHGLEEDKEHDAGESLETNDQSIVGQIFSKRKKR